VTRPSLKVPLGRCLHTGLRAGVRSHKLPGMPIELSKAAHAAALTSLERYFLEENGEPIGNMAAGALLAFFLADIGPAIYNQAIADAQESLQARVAELDIDLHEAPFGYWHQRPRKR